MDKMNQKQKKYLREFNLLNKKYPSKLVSKRRYSFFKYTTILFFILLFLAIPLTVIAQEKINFEGGKIVIKVQHEVSQETLEAITKYIEFTLNNIYNKTE